MELSLYVPLGIELEISLKAVLVFIDGPLYKGTDSGSSPNTRTKFNCS